MKLSNLSINYVVVKAIVKGEDQSLTTFTKPTAPLLDF